MSKKLKPFDLEAALAGKAVMLRDGTRAYVRHHETEIRVGGGWQLQGMNAEGELFAWTEGGRNCSYTDNDIIGMYPETRSINGFEVPAPVTEAPGIGSMTFIASYIFKGFYDTCRWCNAEFDNLMLERGLLFLDKEDAIANAKAMLGIDPDSGSK